MTRSTLSSMTASIVTALVLSGAGVAVAQDKLVLGNEGDYPPYSITNADGSLTGFEPVLAREVCKRIHAECEIKSMDFSALLPSLVAGRIDMIADQLFR